MTEQTPVVTGRFGAESSDTYDGYTRTGGYEGLRAALEMSPDQIIDMVKAAGLRGRGGAGFPTGVKWGFIPRERKPTYLVCNADEGEPGTFKDRELMERDPHQLIEGIAIASYAIEAAQAYIYCRGEFAFAGRQLERAIAEAYDQGILGKRVAGSDYSLDVILHRGAGAYICGEETALLESLEGKRGQPRLRPPFPATNGLYDQPTVVNNVETLSTVPHIIKNGADWFKQWGTEKSPGTKMFCVSGDVERPGNYEGPLGMPVREVIDGFAGGVKGGKKLKAFTPGGSSTPLLTAAHLDAGMDFESIAAAGSLLGTGAIIVLAEDACMVRATYRFMKFYEHESCGKCTPCREGCFWLSQVLHRIENGSGRSEDMKLLTDVSNNIFGRSFCAFGDGAVSPVLSSVKYFADEYTEHIAKKGCPFER
ncbi:MAG: NADH-quinone oxidoreductase subunit NuoF [Actinomycetota bacterium]|nr:NADH-quinone oxidoreductase subunit NuoF [Actinomycetota bacterium]